MQFQDMFPERTVLPPQLPGQQTVKPSVLHQLRLPQLRDLARAYDIEIPRDGTKLEVLPVLVEAEQNGVFMNTQPKRPEYLIKASRSPDDPPVDWESHRPPAFDLSNINDLRAIASKWNETAPEDKRVNSFGKGTDDLKRMLQEAGAI